MRILLIHADSIEYVVKKKTKLAEVWDKEKDSFDEVLVAFCAMESPDEVDINRIISGAVLEIKETAGKVKTDRIMIYPYAHLSSDLASPDIAKDALVLLEKELKECDFFVKRAPFGYYKAFRLSCKGHPLSELSKSITLDDVPLKTEKGQVTHTFFVMKPDGTRDDVENYMDDSAFGSLLKKELNVPVSPGGEPIHVSIMRQKELVDYEPVSDVGHMRWLPKGKLIRDLLADYVLQILLPYGATPVETPVMYDLSDKAIFEHADKFGERQYRFKSGNRSMMLRFAACFGMFSIMRDMHISPNTLPMKMYELSTYSFRHEQKGEVIGLKRLRAFTMPDMHTLCLDMKESLSCFEEQLEMGWKTGLDFGTALVAVFRSTEDFFRENEEWVKKLVVKAGVPVLIEILSERVHYWIAKIDLAAIDGQGRPIENPTVQIDVESARRFDIKYYRENGEPVFPPILHCSPTGSVERVICAILENCGTLQVPVLPTWLSPVQVRIVPVSERHINEAKTVCNLINNSRIRADLDDRDESMGKKVRDAGMDWIPFVVVIGDSEVENNNLTVTIRGKSAPNKPYKETFTVENLVELVQKEIEGKPFRPLYTHELLSKKPRYI